MSLGKLFENGSANEFVRDILDIKSKNNEQCVKLDYVVMNVHSGKHH